jgi:hypothetical protein
MTLIKLSELNLIGISGYPGAGKDTACNWLHENFQACYGGSFATPLKAAASKAFGIPEAHFHDPVVKELSNPYWNVSPREIAQFLGTEMFRRTIGGLGLSIASEDFWIKRLEGKLTGALNDESEGIYEEGETFIIPDVRFQNEYDWLTSNGGLHLRITRPGHDGNKGLANHASEAGFTIWKGDTTWLIENDGTLDELFTKLKMFVSWARKKLSYPLLSKAANIPAANRITESDL